VDGDGEVPVRAKPAVSHVLASEHLADMPTWACRRANDALAPSLIQLPIPTSSRLRSEGPVSDI
jgi:hypothetical protein